MSFVITLYVREGIVMAGDSRLMLYSTQERGDKQIVQLAVGQSDAIHKTFLTPNNIGIATCGAADIQGVPIAGYIESFISEQVTQTDEVDSVAGKLLDYFKELPGPPSTEFYVAGYKTENNRRDQHVWHVEVSKGTKVRRNQSNVQGASWGGETDILSRLLQAVRVLDKDGNIIAAFPRVEIPWGFFTLQDAIDFALYAVKITIDSIRFQQRPKTVGGPIDILVVKPNEASWVQRKSLHI